MNVGEIRITPNNTVNDKNSVKSTGKESGHFADVLREIKIRTEIALKCSKLPDPHVTVDPRAITKMAADENFYNKVMDKINSYTSNQNISANYPSITYSLAIDKDGEWVETMTNEELKKLCEESSKKDKKSDLLKNLLDAPIQTGLQNNILGDVYNFIDYNNVSIDIKRKSRR